MSTLPKCYDNSPLDQVIAEMVVERFNPTGRIQRPKKPKVDNDLEIARRRRILNEALGPQAPAVAA